MSFVKTLATLAVGFAAAKGVEKYNQMGGMAGLQNMMAGMSGNAGGTGGFGGFEQMAEKMFPGGAAAMQNMMAQMQGAASTFPGANASGAAQAGMGGLFSALTAGSTAGAGAMAGLFDSLAKGTPVAPVAEDHAKLMIKTMIQAAKCDGEIDADEQAKIMEHLKDAGPEEVAFVKEQLAAPLDIQGLASEADATVKTQVYGAALMAIRVDSQAESDFLSNLANALGLDEAQVAQIHAAMGVTA
ncbi:DUF533 domain-containing protein [Acidimangrovimonas sediminis]|uniref:DUF533 domain-containing protein n=1 Tax=Acidimangrovimonas sediminis TaxID=2056283 RepID=UPI000C809EFE|nr:DUF533 domain-containing protein [Acidimangrovimonas sediminis]